MAQILKFPNASLPLRRVDNLSHLISALSKHRHSREDVYWLKENAELLNVLECTGEATGATGAGAGDLSELGAELCPDALAPLQSFYKDADRHLCFFKQYYRFILSICMDLEDLGLAGTPSRGEDLAHWVMQQDLPEHELSDLQRAEARRLLARRGLAGDFAGLDDRLHGFVDNTAQFAVPNRKAAYELTHIVFYLSDYGRRDPGLSAAAVHSLNHVGLLAFLDQDADLLSEVCVSLRYCSEMPSKVWEDWLQLHHQGFALIEAGRAGAPALHRDDYHMFLVSSWHQALTGEASFHQRVPTGALRFQRPARQGILHHLSHAAYQLEGQSGDWQKLRPQISDGLSEGDYRLLCEAENSFDGFGTFFEGFARRGTIQQQPVMRVNNG
ncbi:hypothetical protein [Pseudophaeobacter sp.]|uniref:DUF6902 family protein n=1 Tax=Pseudophaeobacter sp. TaxID=1971739 RepID=UPI0032981A9E